MANIISKTFLNQYRVDAFLASGGMGAVYRVWDLKRNVPLAMKVLHSELADDPHVFKRFKREANALKKLTHPNIVQFYGLFKTPEFSFLLEEFINGPSLKDVLRLRAGKPMPVQEALIYLKALSSALGYAHANGVVHCDVKPGNVLLNQGGNIYLTDFGIARHADSDTTTMGVAGTAAYMAPEQIGEESVTPATDVYALGVMLYEMLTGQRPFRGSEVGTEKSGNTVDDRIRHAHRHIQPPDPQSLDPSLSHTLAQAVLTALEKDPARRYQTTQALFEAICAASGMEPAHVSDRVILPAKLQGTVLPNQILPQQTSQTVPPTPIKKPAIPWLVGGAALVLIILAMSMIVSKAQSDNNEIVPPATNAASHIPASPTRRVVASPTLITIVPPTASSVPEITCPGAPHPIRFDIDQPV